MSRLTVVALLVLTAGQVSLVSAQDAEGLNVTDAPKILFSTAGFMDVVPEDEWETFQVLLLLNAYTAYAYCPCRTLQPTFHPSDRSAFLTSHHARSCNRSAG